MIRDIAEIAADNFVVAIDDIIAALKEELEQQGHNASGDLSRSIEARFSFNARNMAAEVLANYYWYWIEHGRKPGHVPYQVIRDWADKVKPGASSKDKDRFSWAVKTKIQKQGYPLPGSFSFSKNGRRKNFIQSTLDEKGDEILKRTVDGISLEIEQILTKII